jgi:hypothetical protein
VDPYRTVIGAKQIETWLKRQNDTLGWFEDDGAPAAGKPKSDRSGARPIARSAPPGDTGEAGDSATQ